jgi:hypothetical protein
MVKRHRQAARRNPDPARSGMRPDRLEPFARMAFWIAGISILAGVVKWLWYFVIGG